MLAEYPLSCILVRWVYADKRCQALGVPIGPLVFNIILQRERVSACYEPRNSTPAGKVVITKVPLH